jgi:Nuclease-related domain
MRLITLSDHAGDLLARARSGQDAALTRAQERYQQDLAVYQRSVASARQEREEAWAQRRPLSWLRRELALRRLQRAQPGLPVVVVPDGRVGALEGGVRGERETARALGAVLDDSWVLIKGYKNPRGEIDYLLLGPGGLFAVEVKYVNGTFTITRGRWSYVKYGNYDKPVERGVLADGGQRKRPPDVQLTEPLAMLEDFLGRFGQPVRFHPVVLLNHPRARIDRCASDLGVQVLTGSSQMLDLARSGAAVLGASRLAEIEGLVVRDHDHHAGRRNRARRR